MKIVAMVRFNNEWAYVFDQPVSLKYREETIDGCRYLIGQSGPFFDFLRYEKASTGFRAFAGRELSLMMEDGSVRKVKDDWWSCSSPIGRNRKITYNTVDNLKDCYVFYGGYCNAQKIKELVEEYDNRTSKPYGHRAGGYRYDYYDFEKIIKFDDMQTRGLRSQARLRTANSHLIKNVKFWAAKARSKPRIRVPAIAVKWKAAAA